MFVCRHRAIKGLVMKSHYSGLILFLPVLFVTSPSFATDDFVDDSVSSVEFKTTETSFDQQSPVLRQIYSNNETTPPESNNKKVNKQLKKVDARLNKTNHEIKNQVHILAGQQRILKSRQAKLKALKKAVAVTRKANRQLDRKIASYKKHSSRQPHRQVASRS